MYTCIILYIIYTHIWYHMVGITQLSSLFIVFSMQPTWGTGYTSDANVARKTWLEPAIGFGGRGTVWRNPFPRLEKGLEMVMEAENMGKY